MDLVVTHPDENETIGAFGTRLKVLLTAEQSGGGLGIFEERCDPGAGPPLHIHHDADETFEIIEGKFRFRWKDQEVEAGPGSVVFIPRGTPHTFRHIGDQPGWFRCMMTPGGFEGFFAEVGAAGLSAPGDFEAISEIGQRYHIEFTGPPLEP